MHIYVKQQLSLPPADLVFLLILVSTCACAALAHPTTMEAHQFKAVTQCPTDKTNSVKHSSKLQCAAVCVVKKFCNQFHFDTANRLCYLGDTSTGQTQWIDGPCVSFVNNEIIETQLALFQNLQMVMFYKFKSSGFANEVNPKQFPLIAHNVTLGSDGAVFQGHTGSYLSTETPGFEQFLDYGNVYSFYLQVRHRIAFTGDQQTQMYHRFLQCQYPWSSGNTFTKDATRVYSYANWITGGFDKIFSMSQNFLTFETQSAVLSVGYSFNRSSHHQFYFNQSVYSGANSLTYSTSGASSAINFQCLRLGYSDNAALCLNGSMQCYGMSTKLLGLDDFKQLEAYCNS